MKETFSSASVDCITKGDTPSASTGAMRRQLGRRVFFLRRRVVFFPVRNRTTQMPETAWEITVAKAAPSTPISRP